VGFGRFGLFRVPNMQNEALRAPRPASEASPILSEIIDYYNKSKT
jgi:hypothetical protein